MLTKSELANLVSEGCSSWRLELLKIAPPPMQIHLLSLSFSLSSFSSFFSANSSFACESPVFASTVAGRMDERRIINVPTASAFAQKDELYPPPRLTITRWDKSRDRFLGEARPVCRPEENYSNETSRLEVKHPSTGGSGDEQFLIIPFFSPLSPPIIIFVIWVMGKGEGNPSAHLSPPRRNAERRNHQVKKLLKPNSVFLHE